MLRPDLLQPLEPSQRKAVIQAARTLQVAGFECFLVGGCVRDLIRGQSTRDLDLTTNALPEQSRQLFKKTIPTGIEHGTITVRLQGHSLELTTYRTEGTYSDGRRPDEVRFGQSLSEDLCRRDFTVNALAYDPVSSELVDEHGGLQDLEQRLIRTIGKPEDRFFEDGLRPIRACRFLSTLDFQLEKNTEIALADPEIHKRASLVAIERFTEELRKGLKSANPLPMLSTIQSTGLLQIFLNRANLQTPPVELSQTELCIQAIPTNHPEMQEQPILARENRLAHYQKQTHSISDSLDWLIDIRIYCWLRAIFPGLPYQELIGLLRRWKFPNHTMLCMEASALLMALPVPPKTAFADSQSKERATLADSSTVQSQELISYRVLIRQTLFQLFRILDHRLEDFLFSWTAYLNSFAPEATSKHECLQELQTGYRDPFRIKDLKVNGKDLMELGFQGKQIGDVLQRCLEQVWKDPTLNSRDSLLEIAGRPQ